MNIRNAEIKDLPRIMEIFAHARRFMAEHGNPDQWGPDNWPPEDLIHSDIKNGKSHVCVQDGEIIGTFFYDQGKNIEPDYMKIDDGAWLDDSDYGVIHRVASSGKKKGIGSAITDFPFFESVCRAYHANPADNPADYLPSLYFLPFNILPQNSLHLHRKDCFITRNMPHIPDSTSHPKLPERYR